MRKGVVVRGPDRTVPLIIPEIVSFIAMIHKVVSVLTKKD